MGTDYQEAQALGEDLADLQAKRAEADVAYTALTDAASAAGTAYSSALDVHNGALTTSLNLVETERHNTELAYNGANASFAAAAQYQSNQVQQDAYARSEAAQISATANYDAAQLTK